MINTSKVVIFNLPRANKMYYIKYTDNKVAAVLNDKNCVIDITTLSSTESIVLTRFIHKLTDWTQVFVYRAANAVGHDVLLVVEDHEGAAYLHTLNAATGLPLGVDFSQAMTHIKAWG